MSEELQTEESSADLVDESTIENDIDDQSTELEEQTDETQEGADLAAAESDETEKNTVDSEPLIIDGVEVTGPDGVKKAIGKQHYKFQEEARQRKAIQAELDQLKAEQAEAVKPVSVGVPDLPETWDDDYAGKMAARDKAIQQNAVAGHSAQVEKDRKFAAQQQQQFEQQQEQQERLNTFNANGAKLGLKSEDLTAASSVVAASGIQPEIARELLGAEDGALLVAYLGDKENSIELYELAGTPLFKAESKLNEIRAKAVAMKPKRSTAPPPAKRVEGTGDTKAVDPLLEGATFT